MFCKYRNTRCKTFFFAKLPGFVVTQNRMDGNNKSNGLTDMLLLGCLTVEQDLELWRLIRAFSWFFAVLSCIYDNNEVYICRYRNCHQQTGGKWLKIDDFLVKVCSDLNKTKIKGFTLSSNIKTMKKEE